MMEEGIFAAAAALFLAACIITWRTRNRTRKVMEHMNAMLEAAMDGSFREEVYDESMLSSVETKLAHYLSASAVSAKNFADEKEKVKQLIADISHQTKTPIANLLLYAQMLEEKELPMEERAFVQELNRQAKKLDFLIVSLVKASRLETGMFVLHPKWDFVDPMLKDVLGQAASKVESKRLAVEYEECGLCAYFDRKWTAEAVYNIVDNAVKYTPEGGRIDISVTDTELFVRIEITDTGIGISEADTAKIFKRFYRGACVSEKEGIGIGLYLARQIIMGENGYIKVKSATGKGSTFLVYLPVGGSMDHGRVNGIL